MSDVAVVYLNALQRLLTTMGRRPDIPTTNTLDETTKSEVQKFQQDVGRPPNGVVDPLTWKDLQGRGCKQSQ
jgi:murein L,D-transpeptidase YcbB/YkuD